MALFQKKPQVSSSAPLYTLGLNKTVLVVGLGNIGKEYENTRHNIGFESVDEFIKYNDFGTWVNKKDLKCQLTTGNIGSIRVVVIKPTTYMNLSGEAVQSACQFYKISPKDMVVVHDDLDVPFGQIRMRVGGSSAGHNGILSIINHMSENFGRIRIGIGDEISKNYDSKDFVLGKFSADQLKQLGSLTKEVNSILVEYISSGTLPHETRSFSF